VPVKLADDAAPDATHVEPIEFMPEEKHGRRTSSFGAQPAGFGFSRVSHSGKMTGNLAVISDLVMPTGADQIGFLGNGTQSPMRNLDAPRITIMTLLNL